MQPQWYLDGSFQPVNAICLPNSLLVFIVPVYTGFPVLFRFSFMFAVQMGTYFFNSKTLNTMENEGKKQTVWGGEPEGKRKHSYADLLAAPPNYSRAGQAFVTVGGVGRTKDAVRMAEKAFNYFSREGCIEAIMCRSGMSRKGVEIMLSYPFKKNAKDQPWQQD